MTDETTSNQSRFGEPWAFRQHRGGWSYIVDKDGDQHVSKRRTVACVNALAGLHPEKLAALIEAVEKYANAHEKWEAAIITNNHIWNTSDGLPHITQEIWDDVIPLQNMRNDVVRLLKELRGEG